MHVHGGTDTVPVIRHKTIILLINPPKEVSNIWLHAGYEEDRRSIGPMALKKGVIHWNIGWYPTARMHFNCHAECDPEQIYSNHTGLIHAHLNAFY